MSRFCPYTGGDVVYPVCAECEDKICDKELFACIVAGSRTYNNFSQMKNYMDFLLQNKEDVLIISGGANGADSLAERYAEESPKCSLIVMNAEWELYGKAAGYIRNEKMHKTAAHFKDRGCVLFWNGVSKGTKQNIALARKYNTPIKIYRFDRKDD